MITRRRTTAGHRRAAAEQSNTDEPARGDGVRFVVTSALVGTTIEWYDFYLYGTAAGIVFNKLFFPGTDPVVATLLAFATFALGFVARPIGGLIFGHVGDRLGRKKTLVSTMTIMGVATVAIGFVPTYAQIGVWAPVGLVVLRIAQGIAIGGEWGGAVLMAVEYAPAHRRGLYGSIPQIGLALGLMLGTGVFAGLSALLPEQAFLAWGWRVAFVASALLVVVGIAVRLRVLETPAFRKLEHREQSASVPVLRLLRDRRSRIHILLGIGTRLAEGITFNAWAVFVLSYGTATLGMSRQPLLVAVMIAAGVMAVFIPVFGAVSDRVGRRTTFCAGAIIACALSVPAFMALQTRNIVLIIVAVSAVLGIAFPIMYGPQAAFYAELFPTPIRYTGSSFVYQFAGIFSSGITPFVLAALVAASGGGYLLVVGYFAAATVVSVVCAALVTPLFRFRFAEAPTAWWYAR